MSKNLNKFPKIKQYWKKYKKIILADKDLELIQMLKLIIIV